MMWIMRFKAVDSTGYSQKKYACELSPFSVKNGTVTSTHSNGGFHWVFKDHPKLRGRLSLRAWVVWKGFKAVWLVMVRSCDQSALASDSCEPWQGKISPRWAPGSITIHKFWTMFIFAWTLFKSELHPVYEHCSRNGEVKWLCKNGSLKRCPWTF